MQQRDVKGIWIPIEVWTSADLTSFEKMLLAEIDSFDSGEGCWASSKYLAGQMEASKSHVNNTICSLIKRGFLIRLKSEHARALRTNFSRHQVTDKSNSKLLTKVRRSKEDKKKSPPLRVAGWDIGGAPLGPLKLSKAVKRFVKFSIEKGYHKQPGGFTKGAQRGGWSRQTLMKWQRDYRWLLQKVDKQKILSTLEWFIEHHNEPYTPIAQTFPSFVKKFEAIDRGRRRDLKSKGGSDNEKRNPKGYWVNDVFVPSEEE